MTQTYCKLGDRDRCPWAAAHVFIIVLRRIVGIYLSHGGVWKSVQVTTVQTVPRSKSQSNHQKELFGLGGQRYREASKVAKVLRGSAAGRSRSAMVPHKRSDTRLNASTEWSWQNACARDSADRFPILMTLTRQTVISFVSQVSLLIVIPHEGISRQGDHCCLY